MQTYNVYYKNNKFRRTKLTREEAIKHYEHIKETTKVQDKDIYIYCNKKGQYVSSTFRKSFLNLQSKLGQIYFDENGMLLENTNRGLKFRVDDKICYIDEQNNTIEYI